MKVVYATLLLVLVASTSATKDSDDERSEIEAVLRQLRSQDGEPSKYADEIDAERDIDQYLRNGEPQQDSAGEEDKDREEDFDQLEDIQDRSEDAQQQESDSDADTAMSSKGLFKNRCKNSPCLNGGTCKNWLITYKCYCRPGYYGRNCQYFCFIKHWKSSRSGGRLRYVSSLDSCQAACKQTAGCEGVQYSDLSLLSRRCYLHGSWSGPRRFSLIYSYYQKVC